MSGEFNIHGARRLEARQLAALRESSAVQRSEDLNTLLRAAAARGGALSGGLLREEVKIIFESTEKMIDTAIANRKELSGAAPELLFEHPYLKEFHRVLDEMADGAVIAVQQRHANPSAAGQFPAAALSAVLREAESRAKTLKTRIDIDIEKMALKGKAPRQSPPQITNFFNAPVSNVAQQSTHVNQTATTGIGSVAGTRKRKLSLEAKIALATLVLTGLGVLAAWLAVPGFLK